MRSTAASSSPPLRHDLGRFGHLVLEIGPREIGEPGLRDAR